MRNTLTTTACSAFALPLLLATLLVTLLPAVNPPAALGQEPQAGARDVERPGRTNLPLPRFVSLASNEVNMRAGPGSQYPIEWVYQRRGLPVEVIDEFDNWRRIRDWQGTTGWVHGSLLSGKRTIRIVGEELVPVHRAPDRRSPLVAQAEPGVIGDLERCERGWCLALLGGFEGWVQRARFYGTFPKEQVK